MLLLFLQLIMSLILILFSSGFLCLGLRLLNLLKHLLLSLYLGKEGLISVFLSLLQRIRHNDIIEKSTRKNLPQLKSNVSAVLATHVQIGVILEVGVRNHWV